MFYRNTLATSDQGPYRYVRSANGTETWTPRQSAPRFDTTTERRMISKFDGKCRECGQKIAAGTEIVWSKANGAKHVECPKVTNDVKAQVIVDAAVRTENLTGSTELLVAIVNGDAEGNAVAAQTALDLIEIRLSAEYDAQRQSKPVTIIPEGRYTIRPADETVASVLSFEAPSFGNFPDGTRAVKVHGNYGEIAPSWYGFALVRPDGKVSLYKNARAVMDAPTAGSTDEQHLRSKIRAAVKAIRLMLDAGTSDLLAYGKAYASEEGKCFVCNRPLLDEESQKRGIGPICLKKFGA